MSFEEEYLHEFDVTLVMFYSNKPTWINTVLTILLKMTSKLHLVFLFTLSIFLKWRPTQVFLKRNLHLSCYVHEKSTTRRKVSQVIACTIQFYYMMIETEIMIAQMSCKVFIFVSICAVRLVVLYEQITHCHTEKIILIITWTINSIRK